MRERKKTHLLSVSSQTAFFSPPGWEIFSKDPWFKPLPLRLPRAKDRGWISRYLECRSHGIFFRFDLRREEDMGMKRAEETERVDWIPLRLEPRHPVISHINSNIGHSMANFTTHLVSVSGAPQEPVPLSEIPVERLAASLDAFRWERNGNGFICHFHMSFSYAYFRSL